MTARSLTERIAEDLKAAMKAGDKLRLETLRTVRAALQEKAVERRPAGGMTAEDEITVLISATKKRKESITIFRANGRPDLADQEERELGIIQEYLPQQLTRSDVAGHVRTAIAAAFPAGGPPPTPKDFGRIMSAVMKELKGKADGGMIQEVVKEQLGTGT